MTPSLAAYPRIWLLSRKSISVRAGVIMGGFGSEATAPVSIDIADSSAAKMVEGMVIALNIRSAWALPFVG